MRDRGFLLSLFLSLLKIAKCLLCARSITNTLSVGSLSLSFSINILVPPPPSPLQMFYYIFLPPRRLFIENRLVSPLLRTSHPYNNLASALSPPLPIFFSFYRLLINATEIGGEEENRLENGATLTDAERRGEKVSSRRSDRPRESRRTGEQRLRPIKPRHAARASGQGGRLSRS